MGLPNSGRHKPGGGGERTRPAVLEPRDALSGLSTHAQYGQCPGCEYQQSDACETGSRQRGHLRDALVRLAVQIGVLARTTSNVTGVFDRICVAVRGGPRRVRNDFEDFSVDPIAEVDFSERVTAK